MKTFMQSGTTRACAVVGVVGATTLGIGAHAATAANNSLPGIGKPRTLFAAAGGSVLGPPPFHSRAHADRVAVAIKKMVAAGNQIEHLPYVYGGGHGSFTASGYDCSGSVSFVLHGAGLVSTPLDSTDLESFGDPGRGKHVTIYANAGHAWMTIDGRRYDTNALQESGTRWSSTISSSDGYVVRHPRGL
jgi:cell wall-associated NlpC family hydrolase